MEIERKALNHKAALIMGYTLEGEDRYRELMSCNGFYKTWNPCEDISQAFEI